jgi:RimJ/RimL family protein N-acetyltransferase
MNVALHKPNVILRPYRSGDEAALQAAADNIRIARYMFAGFPHPYTAEDAVAWVSRASAENPIENFVIEVAGALAGAVGLSPRGPGYEGVGVVGYWLSPAHWSNGIATWAVGAIVEHAATNGFRRLVASVYAPNVGSIRVLEKNGFVLEGRLREHRVGRDGVVMDELLYGMILTDIYTNAGVS